MVRQGRGGDSRGERARREKKEKEDIEQKLQDPGRATDRVLDPAAAPGLSRRVEAGDPAACSGKRWSTKEQVSL